MSAEPLLRSRDVVIGKPKSPLLALVPEAHPRRDPLIIALYGGPGTGKSTTAAAVFARLKMDGVNCELVHEVAKDLTWEERKVALGHQPYIIAKQMFRYDRLYGQVDCIVTDTSPLLAGIYLREGAMPLQVATNFLQWVRSDWRARNTLDVFLQRDPTRPYNTAGRSQNEEEAKALDFQIENLLALQQQTLTVRVDKDTSSHVDAIVEEAKRCLRL